LHRVEKGLPPPALPGLCPAAPARGGGGGRAEEEGGWRLGLGVLESLAGERPEDETQKSGSIQKGDVKGTINVDSVMKLTPFILFLLG
jgi:hypothetical protein